MWHFCWKSAASIIKIISLLLSTVWLRWSGTKKHGYLDVWSWLDMMCLLCLWLTRHVWSSASAPFPQYLTLIGFGWDLSCLARSAKTDNQEVCVCACKCVMSGRMSVSVQVWLCMCACLVTDVFFSLLNLILCNELTSLLQPLTWPMIHQMILWTHILQSWLLM